MRYLCYPINIGGNMANANWNHQASMSPNRNKLIGTGSARAENFLAFEVLPTLGDLRRFLAVIVEELLVYKAWPVSLLHSRGSIFSLVKLFI